MLTNKLKKLLKYLLLLFMLVLVSCSAQTNNSNKTDVVVDSKNSSGYDDRYVNNFLSQIDKSKLVKLHAKDSSIDVCESILFGKYEIDGNLSNGLEDIEWVILDISEDDKEAILISKYVLDYKAYVDAAYALKDKYQELKNIYNSNDYYEWLKVNIDAVINDIANIYGEKSEKISWETSTLREWLNKDFYNTAFSKNEKSIIKKKELVSKRFETECQTKDDVFCIDANDLGKYFNCDEAFNEQIGIIDRLYYAKSTKFATKVFEEVLETIEENKNKGSLQDSYSNYWFRSMNTQDAYTSMMSKAGLNFFSRLSHREKCTANVESRNIGVRPAICIDLSLDTIKERSTKLVEGFDNKIKFNERMFGSKKTKSDEKLKENVAENEEDVDYYYTGGKWN